MENNVYKLYFRYFLKNKLYVWITAIQLLLVLAGITFFSSFHYTGFRLLYLFSRWNFYFSITIAVFAYVLFTEAVNVQCAEVIDAIRKKKLSWQNGMGRVLILVLAGYHLILTAGLLYASVRNDGTSYFFSFFPRAYLMNIVIPQVLVIGAAYVASCIYEKNKWFAHSLFLLLCITTSPLFEGMIWREKPQGIRIDLVVEKIKWIFSIFYKNAEWSPDTQYGLQTENVRLYLQCFWLLLILAVVLWFYRKRKVSIFCGGISALFLILSYAPASLYRLNESWDGIFSDFMYYNDEGLDIREMQETDYKIAKYNLTVELKNNLKVKGKMTVEAPVEKDTFIFTLYHGYQVKTGKVDKNEAAVKRNGDQLTVTLPKAMKKFDLILEYEGSSEKFYSNSQAVMLPGYFPWYPMAGEKQIFIQYPYYNGGNGYHPYNRIPTAEFEVKIHTASDVVTNLDEKANHLYAGKSDGLSIIGGNIQKTNKESIFLDYLPLELCQKSEKQYLTEMDQRWNQTLQEIQTVFGLDIDELRKKKILLASKDLGRNFSNNNFVEFGDYLLASEGYLDSASYINYRLHGCGKESRIGDLLCSAIIRTDVMTPEKIIEKMLLSEKEHRQMREALGEEPDSVSISEELEQLAGTMGAEDLVKEIIQYLLDSQIENDEEFFGSLQTGYV